MVFGDDHVAGAKQAKALTKRQMHVNRNWRACRFGLFVSAAEFVEIGPVALKGLAEPLVLHRASRTAG